MTIRALSWEVVTVPEVTKQERCAAYLIRSPETIWLISDPERSEILRALSNQSMTCTQLANHFGTTKAAVGYHVSLLLNAGLIKLERSEVESHGIVQKYYTTKAGVCAVDPAGIPKEVRRRFLLAQMYRLRGMFILSQVLHDGLDPEVSLRLYEDLAERMLQQVAVVALRYEEMILDKSPETIEIMIYAEALSNLLKDSDWSTRLQQYLKLNPPKLRSLTH